MGTFGRYSAMYTREISFVTLCLLLCIPNDFQRGVYSTRKTFTPKGAGGGGRGREMALLFFRVDIFSEKKAKSFYLP